ncbi:MAG: hypothetical protein ABII90_02830 [Bacteroidota bacterium]
MLRSYLILILLFICCNAFPQPKVKYDKDFEFKEGIYLIYEQFKHNDPIPKSKIISKFDKNELGFLSKLLLLKKIEFIDSAGNKEAVLTSSIWGYSNNNIVYINIQGEFNRIPIIGNICHFTAVVTVYDNHYYDPYSFNQGGYASNEFRQYILDVRTGNILDYTISDLESLLIRDQQLYDEFTALKKRKKKDSMFIYLRKYNEKHPAYFGKG